MSIENTDTWRAIPPEEKVELMARAQSKGFMAAFMTCIVGSTIALSLHVGAIMWASIIIAPFVFQFAAGKAWRGFRPRLMLEYLACRSAARRFAFSAGSKDLTANLIFRGQLELIFEQEDSQERLDAEVNNNQILDVWIAVFRDTLIMLTERPGGATIAVSSPINDKMKVESSDNGGYTQSKEVLLSVRDKLGADKRYKVTSKYPAALVVFEKRLLKFQIENRERIERELKMLQNEADVQDPLDFELK